MSGDVSAAPEALRQYRSAQAESADALNRRAAVLDASVSRLARTGSAGLGRLPTDLAVRLRVHAHSIDAVGTFTGDVGDAFASVAAGPVVSTDDQTILDWFLERGDIAGQLGEPPEHWPGLVAGDNGCPAISLPMWFGTAGDRGERQAWDEPVWTALQTACRPAAQGQDDEVEAGAARESEVRFSPLPGGGIAWSAARPIEAEVVRVRGRNEPRPPQRGDADPGATSPLGPNLPIDEFLDRSENVTEVTAAHRVPDAAVPNSVVIVRRDRRIVGYTLYGSDGYRVARVDLEGRAHNGLEPPHTTTYTRNRAPAGVFVNEGDTVSSRPWEIPRG